MDTIAQYEISCNLHCIYEFNECQKNLDCISCVTSRRYWDEMNNIEREEAK